MSESHGIVVRDGLSTRVARFIDLLGPPQGFNSYEHRTLAELIKVDRLEELEGGYPNDWNGVTLHLGDGLKLQYGQIIALGGDFYGEPDSPISSGATEHDQHDRFRAAFDRLVRCDRKELKGLLNVMAEEEQWISRKLRRDGVWPNVAYGEIDLDTEYKNAANREHWYSLYSRYLEMALTNFDHFGVDAVAAYKAGHHVALETAVQAHRDLQHRQLKTVAEAQLEQALAMNAFADHYLTDLFAAGHLRTPRRRLDEQNGGSQYGGGALSKSQHFEDNSYGLFVSNAFGEHWLCTGDAHLMTPAGHANRLRARAAVQASAQEVLDAFKSGEMKASSQYRALQMAPDVAKACKDEALDKVSEAERLNHVAQFIDRSAELPGVALVNSIYVRTPLATIDATAVEKLKETERPWGNLGERTVLEEFWNWMFGCKPGLYGPPKHALPKPPKPIADGVVPAPTNRGGSSVRYAIAYLATRAYPGGGSAEYLSEPSGWSAWVNRAHGSAPAIKIPPLPSMIGRAVPHSVVIIRQDALREPEIDIARLDVATTTTRFADILP